MQLGGRLPWSVFQALSDPTRRVYGFAAEAGDDRRRDCRSLRSAVGALWALQHLKNAGLIIEKNGTSIVYSLNVSVVGQTMAAMMDCWTSARIRKESHEIRCGRTPRCC
jgi:hypothetical protein